MSKFETSKGFGVDNIPSFFLEKGVPIFAGNLNELINLSMSIGQFPDSWKVTRVAPIYKYGTNDDRSNYKPISVLLVVMRFGEADLRKALFLS